MIRSVQDLKNRTLVESNVLKQMVLSSAEGYHMVPVLDDVLIHDYQIASSTTLNTMFINTLVNLKRAELQLKNEQQQQSGSTTQDSYFRILRGLSADNVDSDTRLVLSVDEGDGVFYVPSIGWTVKKIGLDDGKDESTERFVNLDAIWYGIRRRFDSSGNVLNDSIVIVKDMNDFGAHPNPYGTNIFSTEAVLDDGYIVSDGFNGWLSDMKLPVDCIVDNLFCSNLNEHAVGDGIGMGDCLNESKMIVCAGSRLCGLQPLLRNDGSFDLKIWDLGSRIASIDQEKYARGDYRFLICSFNSIADDATLLIVYKELLDENHEQYHYLYVNSESFDEVYGFAQIVQLVNDQLIIHPDRVFSKVQDFRGMNGDITIALTDYGFWDLERNRTGDVTWSYKRQKSHDALPGSQMNTRQDKLTSPIADVQDSDIVSEYDRIWRLDEDGVTYSCDGLDNVMWLNRIRGQQKILCGTSSFALYERGAGHPLSLMGSLWDDDNGDMFSRLLFSEPQLVQAFTEWLYSTVTCHSGGLDFGEWYLCHNHSAFATKFNQLTERTFQGLEYSMTDEDVNTRFSSMKTLVKSEMSGSPTLQKCCKTIYDMTTSSRSFLDWVASADFSARLASHFNLIQYERDVKDGFVQEVADGLVSEHGLLSYFASYFRESFGRHLLHRPSSTNAEVTDGSGLVENVQTFIQGVAPASLTIGGYDLSKTGNERYPGLDSYVPRTSREISRSEVEDVMSIAAAKDCMVAAVKSCEFFTDEVSYANWAEKQNSNLLFQPSENLEFAKKSGLVDDVNNVIKIEWQDLRDFVFEDSISDSNLLKAFLRTQVYRPLFFNAKDHETFTSNSDAYWCRTHKSHIRFDGMKCDLKFQDGTWDVDAGDSGLDGEEGQYDIQNLTFSIKTNVLDYDVAFAEKDIVDGKFVNNDVQYYLVQNPETSTATLYFNEFQKDVESSNDWIDVGEYGRFEYKGAEYILNNGWLNMVVNGESQVMQRLIDGRFFFMDGIQFSLSADGRRVEYASADDNALVEARIDEHGHGTYFPWRIEFQFNEDWTKVSIVQKVQTEVSDEVIDEHCELDSQPDIVFGRDGTWSWAMAQSLLKFMDRHPDKVASLRRLGNGVIYSGGLVLDNTNGTKCSIRLVNEIKGGKVSGTAEMDIGGGSATRLCMIYDRNGVLASSSAFLGDVSEEGLVNRTANGDKMVVMKSSDGGMNFCNAVWIDKDTWNANVRLVENVGHTRLIDDETGMFEVEFDTDSTPSLPSYLALIPEHDEQEAIYGKFWKYLVNVNMDGTGQYEVQSPDEGSTVHVVVNGERYIIDLKSGQVDKMVFNEMLGTTMDFDTRHQIDALHESLFVNVRDAMLNWIVQAMLDNGDETTIDLNGRLSHQELLLDLFSDEFSADVLVSARSRTTKKEMEKFKQVFKNSLQPVSEKGARNGRAYGHLLHKMDSVFANSNAIFIVDEPSILAERVNGVDRFTCSAVMDLKMHIGSDVLKDVPSGYAIGNATIKGIKVHAVITPTFDFENGMKYAAEFSVADENGLEAEYSQISYVHDGQIRTRTISPKTTRIDLQGWRILDSATSKDISHLTSEILTQKIASLFTSARCKQIAEAVNGSIEDTEWVTVDSVKNPRSEDWNDVQYNTVWGIGQQIPEIPADFGVVVCASKGKTIYNGCIYELDDSEEKPKLKQKGGQDEFGLEYITSYEDPSQESDDGEDEDDSIDAPKKVEVLVAMGKEIVKQEDIEREFTVSKSGDDVYLEFKNDRFAPVVEDAQFSVNVDDVYPSWDKYIESVSTDVYQPDYPIPPEDEGEDPQPRCLNYLCVRECGEPEDGEQTMVGKGLGTLTWTVKIPVDDEGDDETTFDPTAFPIPDQTLALVGVDIRDSESNEDESEDEDGVDDDETSDSSRWIGVKGECQIRFSDIAVQAEDDEEAQSGDEGEGTESDDTGMRGTAKVTVLPDLMKSAIDFDFLPLDDDNGVLVSDMTIYTPVPDVPADCTWEIQELSSEDAEDTFDDDDDWGESSDKDDGDSSDDDEGIIDLDINSLQTPRRLKAREEEEEGEGDQEEDASAPRRTMVFTFKIPVVVKRRSMMCIPEDNQSYNTASFLVRRNESGVQVNNIISLFDFYSNSIGDLEDAYVQYPVNAASAASPKNYITRLVHLKIDGAGTDHPSISSGAVDSPFSIVVLPPTESTGENGDIYDRYYEVDRKVYADVAQVDMGSKCGIDVSGTRGSARTSPTSLDFEELTHQDGAVDQAVPRSMADGIAGIVLQKTRLGDGDFLTSMTHLHNFLSSIQAEILPGSFGVHDIASICQMKYSAEPQFIRLSPSESSWDDDASGLFGWQHDGDLYGSCLDQLNDRMRSDFFSDYSMLSSDSKTPSASSDAYYHILDDNFSYGGQTYSFKQDGEIDRFRAKVLFDLAMEMKDVPSESDLTHRVFGDKAEQARCVNVMDVDVGADMDVVQTYVVDGQCHVFAKSAAGQTMWYVFPCTMDSIIAYMEKKISSGGKYVVSPHIYDVDGVFPLKSDSNWRIRSANRDLTGTSSVHDAYSVLFSDGSSDLWWLSSVAGYIESPHGIQDLAWEDNTKVAYVLFKGDNHVYVYENISSLKDAYGRIHLLKENADMRVETFLTTMVSSIERQWKFIYLDYIQDSQDWTITLYGSDERGYTHVESWLHSPGQNDYDFRQYNIVVFGDTMFDQSQLRFQNISKNKDMYDIVDVHEIDECYYGLFRDSSEGASDGNNGNDVYAVFKTDGTKGGVVQKLSFDIVHPSLLTSSDSLYSLYAVALSEDDERTPVIQEVSVPNVELYADRTIPINDILQKANLGPDGKPLHSRYAIKTILMSQFRTRDVSTAMFVLTDKGFYKVGYEMQFKQISIDRLQGDDESSSSPSFKQALKQSLAQIMDEHIAKMHSGEDGKWFSEVAKKVNQFSDGFSMFDLIPTEFTETQDIGVVPDSRIDDTDEETDHRPDSVQVSTDILQTQGMFAFSTTNPGVISAAVSNPATTYDDDNVFTKSQRNTLIEGTEFYDYIYDQDGNVLLDLYAISFIYLVNSNNTYDLYINVPTTRTKYINRIAGTLKSDGTSQVLKDDSRPRLNFNGESLPNNLDESTTRLKVFIDRKYISVGNIELVEICGNTIPTLIYRDPAANDGLYDSIALESRWNGEVEEIVQPEKDMNKVALEFECYGTDGQSIHIRGKTLIHHVLDDSRYDFSK